jgi:hypothetical protein
MFQAIKITKDFTPQKVHKSVEKLLQQDKNHQGKILVMKLSEPKDPIESEEQLLLFDLNIPENTGS